MHRASQDPSATHLTGNPPASPLRRILGIFRALLLWIASVWAFAALAIDLPTPQWRIPVAAAYAAALVVVAILTKHRPLRLALTTIAPMLVLAWWLSLQPSQHRDWQPDVAVLPYADIQGNQITLHHIRNCRYRTETDFDVRYYDRTFDLDRLRSTDLMLVYWGSPHIAHSMVSFGFEGGGYVCFSIETRKEKGEAYSAIKGLFRQYELIYVAADEEDVVRLRTHCRQGEEVYLFRLTASPERMRALFLEYIQRMNQLRHQPEWYHALSQNCTTSLRTQRAATDRIPWDWRMLLNGHGDELLYERGAIATHLPLAELRKRAHINSRARAANPPAPFSQQIRLDVPGIDPGH